MTQNKKNLNKTGRLNKKDLSNLIIEIFNKDASVAFNYKQLAKRLDIKDDQTRILISQVLRDLKSQGLLDEVHTGKYRLKQKAGYITGKVDLTTKGYAYILTGDLSEPVFVSQINLRTAFHGDIVKVYLYAKRSKFNYEGEVVQIVERAKTTFVGTLEVSKNYAFLIPDHRQMPYDIYIPIEKIGEAKSGQKAIVNIIEWPQKAKNPIGEIVEVLGNAGSNEAEMHAILAEFELPYRFPEDVNNAAEKIDDVISEAEIAKRRDFRDVFTITIDPEDAKDFDDALSLKQISENVWEVGVHIADVSHYVTPGSLLDKEAYNRATSVYLVDRVVPMLPEKLSNNVCSLRPNEDKLCYSAVFELDANANIISQWFGRTVIHSNRRFNYEEAQKIIEEKSGEYVNEILTLDTLAKKLRAERFKYGSLGFDRMEVKFKIDEFGKPLGVFFKESKDSNKLIEEFMLLANKKVAEFVGKEKTKRANRPFVYRIHDKPDPEKLNSFSNFIKKFGYKIKTSSDKMIAKSMNQLLEEIAEKKEKNVIESLAIRTMAKAEYSTKNIGHYGLGFVHYTHFTSPIRRYPDVLSHRLLETYLTNSRLEHADKLEDMCKHSSEMEQKAANAERASVKYKQVEFMSDKIGNTYDGIITGVTEWGLYVEVSETHCEGLVPVRDMNDDYYIFDEENYCLVGKHKKTRYQLGDTVRIKIVSANLAKKHLTYCLV